MTHLRYNGKYVKYQDVIGTLYRKIDIIKFIFDVGELFTRYDIEQAVIGKTEQSLETVIDEFVKMSIIVECADENYQIHHDIRPFLESLFDEYRKVSSKELFSKINLLREQREMYQSLLSNYDNSKLKNIVIEIVRNFEDTNSLFQRNSLALNREIECLKRSEDLKHVKMRHINYLWDNYVDKLGEIVDTCEELSFSTENTRIKNITNTFISMLDKNDDFDSCHMCKFLEDFKASIQQHYSSITKLYSNTYSAMLTQKDNYKLTNAVVGASIYLQSIVDKGKEENSSIESLSRELFRTTNITVKNIMGNDNIVHYINEVKDYKEESIVIDNDYIHGNNTIYAIPSIDVLGKQIEIFFNKNNAYPQDLFRYFYDTYNSVLDFRNISLIYISFYYHDKKFSKEIIVNESKTIFDKNKKATYCPIRILGVI